MPETLPSPPRFLDPAHLRGWARSEAAAWKRGGEWLLESLSGPSFRTAFAVLERGACRCLGAVSDTLIAGLDLLRPCAAGLRVALPAALLGASACAAVALVLAASLGSPTLPAAVAATVCRVGACGAFTGLALLTWRKRASLPVSRIGLALLLVGAWWIDAASAPGLRLFAMAASAVALLVWEMRWIGTLLPPPPAFTDEERARPADSSTLAERLGALLADWRRRGLGRAVWVLFLALLFGAMGFFFYRWLLATDGPTSPEMEEGAATALPVRTKLRVVPVVVSPNNSPIAVRVKSVEHDDSLIGEIDDWTRRPPGPPRLGETGEGRDAFDNILRNGPMAFVRLDHGGAGWDVGRWRGADRNILRAFGRISRKKAESDGQILTPAALDRIPAAGKPLFVYATGYGSLPLSKADAQALRTYLIDDGGTLIADCGAAAFSRGVQAACRRLFPGKSWGTIGHDDPMFRFPTAFPEGPPMFCNHAGHGVLGLKHEGRWIVILYPGDMKDVWQDGHAGASPAVVDRIERLGVNFMCYAGRMAARHRRQNTTSGEPTPRRTLNAAAAR